MRPNQTLMECFENHEGRPIMKVEHYMEIYEKHFERFRNRPVNILEIGIFQGGSLQLWKKYFGEQANIFGLDIEPKCKKFEEDRIKISIGDQGNRQFMKKLAQKLPPLDILIDDGGHTMKQQKVTFNVMYSKVKENGVYLCEDVATSYMPKYGGGYLKPRSFIEFAKRKIDYLNACYSQDENLKIDNFTKSTHSMHFYNSIVVFEKGLQNSKEPEFLTSSGRKGETKRSTRIKTKDIN